MTGLIGALIGAAASAVDQFAGKVPGNEPGSGAAAEDFATILAGLTSSKASRGPAESASEPGLPAAEQSADESEVSTEDFDPSLGAANGTGAAITAVEDQGSPMLSATEAQKAEATNTRHIVDRDLEKLSPELRRRLGRVIERMESEFGHSVSVVEGHRSQERQNFLYEQGRSRPGNVVTWTRDSKHLEGRAVDVLIDGTYENRVAYERLARIAAEEGLRTLGPNDAGHIELPGSGEVRLADVSAGQRLGSGAVPALARVAEVARVARVARVAEVARVADPMRSAGTTQSSVMTAGDPAITPAIGVNISGDSSNSSGEGQGRQGESTSPTPAQLDAVNADPGLARAPTVDSTGIRPVEGSDAVQRAARILALKESASTVPVNHLTLRIDGASGSEDRIRVDLRGGTVGTTLSLENGAEAERLLSRAGELRQSLERRGLEADAVRIRTITASGMERIESARAAFASIETDPGRSGGRPGSEPSSGRESWQEAREHQRRDSGSPHQRQGDKQPQEGRR